MNKIKQVTGMINDITAVLFRLAIIFMLLASYDTMHNIVTHLEIAL